MFALDRELLVLEPNVFRDVGWASQRLVSGTATLGGGVVTFSGGVTVTGLGIEEGHVVVYGDTPLEVTGVAGASALNVSRLRPRREDEAIAAPDAASATATVWTFRPQIEAAHQQVLRMLGLSASGGEGLTEDDVTNAEELREVEALGALYLAYSAASALSGPGSALGERAEVYRKRYAAERMRAAARIDTNGDGAPDVVRRMNMFRLTRA